MTRRSPRKHRMKRRSRMPVSDRICSCAAPVESTIGRDDAEEVVGFEAGAADESAIDVDNAHQLLGVRRLHRLDAELAKLQPGGLRIPRHAGPARAGHRALGLHRFPRRALPRAAGRPHAADGRHQAGMTDDPVAGRDQDLPPRRC